METTEEKPETKTRWVIDAVHSDIAFSVRHMMITNVKGEFQKFSASLDTEGNDLAKSILDVTIDASSIFTKDDTRDGHLISPDFFDVDRYPAVSFKSRSFSNVAERSYHVKGMLTIKNVSREITLNAEFGGIQKDPWGNDKAGFYVETKINRKDFGLTWNAPLETGGVLVSDDVKIAANVQFVKQV